MVIAFCLRGSQVTSPSEAALPEPHPLFASWPSIKNLSSPECKVRLGGLRRMGLLPLARALLP